MTDEHSTLCVARRMDWRLHDLTVQLVDCIDDDMARLRSGAADPTPAADPAPDDPRHDRRTAGSHRSVRRGE